MSGDEDRDAWIRSAFGPQPAVPAPVAAPEFELARVVAAAQLLSRDPQACRHCRATWHTIAGHPDAPTLPRAVELRHEPGCPDVDA